MRHLFLILMISLMPIVTITAQTTGGTWEQILTEVTPPARYDHVLVLAGYDYLVLFGGRNRDEVLGDTWIFDLESSLWREVLSENAPPARFGFGAAYDAPRNRVLIFGGQADGLFNDVWAFDLETETWSEITAGGTLPGVRYGNSAVYDVAQDRLIISHGFADGRYDDTFALDLVTNLWTDISPETRPFERCLHEAIYDYSRQAMMLFGGCSSPDGPCPQGDLWMFAGDRWTELTPEGVLPSPRYNPALVSDQNGSLWLLGGSTDDGRSNDLWMFDLDENTWQLVSETVEELAPRNSHDAAWDAARGRLIVFGGRSDDGAMNDLWIYTP